MRRADWLVQQLPVGMAEDEFLVRFVRVFQDVAETVLVQVDNIPHLFDATVAPDVMVRTLGAWVGLDWVDPTMDDAQQRTMVRRYADGLLWRGTRRALTTVLEAICGTPVTITDSGGVYAQGRAPAQLPFVRIDLPGTGRFTEGDLARIVRSELPASVTFELVVGGRTVHPRPEAAILTASVI